MASGMRITPLEDWIAGKLGVTGKPVELMERLRIRQLELLNATLAHAARHSPFYRRRLGDCRPLVSLSGLADLPFTTSADLSEQGLQMLAVSQGEIKRIVTLRSSGTTGQAKRVYFTRSDLEYTKAFFRCGMSRMLQPGQRVLVLLPGELPDSAGRLLADALQQQGISCHVAGLVSDPGAIAALLVEEPFDCVVGIPVQVLGVVRHPLAAEVPTHRIGSVFLTSDYVPSALVGEIRRVWGCPAVNHYGMTELGLTCGVECHALDGYHLREPDLYFEVVDPVSGAALRAGETGEVVVTTLTRLGMPLIRYRTGDLARFMAEPCPCGSVLPRLGKVQGRLAARVDLGGLLKPCMSDLDEALFSLRGLLNFRAVLTMLDTDRSTLQLMIETLPGAERRTRDHVDRRLPTIPALRAAVAAGRLVLQPTVLADAPLSVSATVKRIIEQPQKENANLETAC
ncbi:DVU_1553 family AMP-dependent CoA ligase [Syntrophotalea carbinolica]|nr:AMP-binding protein [Syntrophotalea carbinolica]